MEPHYLRDINNRDLKRSLCRLGCSRLLREGGNGIDSQDDCNANGQRDPMIFFHFYSSVNS
jgi:hypothetical protein